MVSQDLKSFEFTFLKRYCGPQSLTDFVFLLSMQCIAMLHIFIYKYLSLSLSPCNLQAVRAINKCYWGNDKGSVKAK